MKIDTPESEDWLKRHKPGRLPPADPGAKKIAEQIAQHEGKQDLLKHGVSKRLTARFGSKRSRRNQLVARLKRSRQYKPPVRGGRKNRRGFRAR